MHLALAGQGLNMTMEDAAELAWHVQQQGLTPDALRSFELERIPRVGVIVKKAQVLQCSLQTPVMSLCISALLVFCHCLSYARVGRSWPCAGSQHRFLGKSFIPCDLLHAARVPKLVLQLYRRGVPLQLVVM